jgi:hypothetical protein
MSKSNLGKLFLGGAILLVVLVGAFSIFASQLFPYQAINNPKTAHYHLRMQVIVDGEQVNFADTQFQTPNTSNNLCSVALTATPIHFHDGQSQLVHIHWAGITGGLLLKNYGLNLIGGPDYYLGFQFKLGEDTRVGPVAIHADGIKQPKTGSKAYVYTGDSKSYQKREMEDFLKQDLEKFFGTKTEEVKAEGFNLFELLVPKVSAHTSKSTEVSTTTQTSVSLPITDPQKQARLEEDLGLIGNVVIFIQENEPATSEITAKFSKLELITTSSCSE